jgi:hypothetical protein
MHILHHGINRSQLDLIIGKVGRSIIRDADDQVLPGFLMLVFCILVASRPISPNSPISATFIAELYHTNTATLKNGITAAAVFQILGNGLIGCK